MKSKRRSYLKISISREISAPASLAGIGFITKAKDRKLLQDKEYKKQIALAITEEINDYFKRKE